MLVQVLLSWDKDVHSGIPIDQALNESLCNQYNPIKGSTPLLECLLVAARMFKRKEVEWNADDQHFLLSLLQVAQLLIDAPYINPLMGVLRVTEHPPPRPILGGGLSAPLLFLVTQELVDQAYETSLGVEHRQFLKYTSETLERLQLALMEIPNTRRQLSRLQELLLEEHDLTQTRMGLSNISCIRLALRTNRRQLIRSQSVQEATMATWHRVSRYNFWVSFIFYFVVVLSITMVGVMNVGDKYVTDGIRSTALSGLDDVESIEGWWAWLDGTFMPAVQLGSQMHPTASDSSGLKLGWSSIDAIRIQRHTSDSSTCSLRADTLAKAEMQTVSAVCSALLSFHSREHESIYLVPPVHSSNTSQLISHLLGSAWIDVATKMVSVTSNVLFPKTGLICRTDIKLHINAASQLKTETRLDVMHIWSRTDPLLTICTCIVALSMLMSLSIEVKQILVSGWRSVEDFWDGIDLLHNATFLLGAILWLVESGFAFYPSDVSPHSHFDFFARTRVHTAYLRALSVLVMLTWVRLLKYLRAVKSIGIIIQVLQQMLMSVSAFFVLWAVLWMGFASSLLVLFGNVAPHMETWSETLLYSLGASVGNVAPDEFEDAGVIGSLYYVMLLVVIAIFLFTLLTAILSKTYSDIVDEAEAQYLMMKASLTEAYYIKLATGARPTQASPSASGGAGGRRFSGRRRSDLTRRRPSASNNHNEQLDADSDSAPARPRRGACRHSQASSDPIQVSANMLTTYYPLPTTYYSLLTTHYSLLTTHYSLLTTYPYYSLLTTHYSLLTTHYSLLTTHHSLHTTHYSLHTTHYTLLTTHYSLLATHYSLLTTHYSLLTTHYSLLTTHYHYSLLVYFRLVQTCVASSAGGA